MSWSPDSRKIRLAKYIAYTVTYYFSNESLFCQVSIFNRRLGWHQQIGIKLRWLFKVMEENLNLIRIERSLLSFFLFFPPIDLIENWQSSSCRNCELLAQNWPIINGLNDSPCCQNYCPQIHVVRKYRYRHRYRPSFIAKYRYRPIMKKPISQHPY